MDILSDTAAPIDGDDVAEAPEYLKNMAQARLNGLPAWIATNSMPPVNEMNNLYIMAMLKRHKVCVESMKKELGLYRRLRDKQKETKQKKTPGLCCFLCHSDEDDLETSPSSRSEIQTQIEKLESDLTSTETLVRQYKAALDDRYDAIKTVDPEFKALVEHEFQKVNKGKSGKMGPEFRFDPAQLQSHLGSTFNLLKSSDYSWEMFMLPPQRNMEPEVLEIGAKVHKVMRYHLWRHKDSRFLGALRPVAEPMEQIVSLLQTGYESMVRSLHEDGASPDSTMYQSEAPYTRDDSSESGGSRFNRFGSPMGYRYSLT
ncbi:hypothetical protein SeLEV6574_g01535 [Synchytrium endobioticum]|uniref:Uncharacterized protein n=1 Tax=Synchytrium endobioticum TaxID=286115 RepID=A0A507DD75_9FUNG|nr:hypothetical protein SeLEV6574_g01535 [Synchytrium endobioticum]